MATGNFFNVNASSIFAVYFDDSFNPEDFISDMRERLSEIGYLYDDSMRDTDSPRSYPGEILGEKTEYMPVFCASLDEELTIVAVARNGYYEGANLDYHIYAGVTCSDDINSLDRDEVYSEILWAIKDEQMANSEKEAEEMAEHHTQEFYDWTDKTKAKLVDELEAIYREHSVPLKVLGRASNGEQFYQKE